MEISVYEKGLLTKRASVKFRRKKTENYDKYLNTHFLLNATCCQ